MSTDAKAPRSKPLTSTDELIRWLERSRPGDRAVVPEGSWRGSSRAIRFANAVSPDRRWRRRTHKGTFWIECVGEAA